MTTSEEATELVQATVPLCRTLNIAAVELDREAVVLEMEWAEGLCTSGGLLHGGAIMALADSAGGGCALLNLPEGAVGTSTIESKTNFLGAVTDGTIRATATPLHRGSTTIVVETEIRHNDKLVAKVTQTQAVLRPRS